MPDLLPLFLNLTGRRVLVVGAGPVAAGKLRALLAAGADVTVVAPAVDAAIVAAGVRVERREFVHGDLDDVWLVVAAATPEVNRVVAAAAEARRVFVNAVDDPANASAFLSGVVRRDGVTLAISTAGEAPALAGLLREAFDAVLPDDLEKWVNESQRQRRVWRRDQVPMAERRPLLLDALNHLYGRSKDLHYGCEFEDPHYGCESEDLHYTSDLYGRPKDLHDGCEVVAQDFSPAVNVPWMSAPEDSWL
jgi:uroporphyrin-III C-methyltransferase / precorrin-2 dehydrogenase / sirohydrochlorin ferrochelatase